MVTGVNDLSFGGRLGEGLLVVVGSLGHEGLGKSGFVADGALEVANRLTHEALVAELEHWGTRCGSSLDSLELGIEGFGADVVGLGVLHPGDREKISQAGTNAGAVDLGLSATVSSVR